MNGTQRWYRLLVAMMLAIGLLTGALAGAQAAPLHGTGPRTAAQSDGVETPPSTTVTVPATLPATEPVSTETATVPAETPVVTEPAGTEPPATEPSATEPPPTEPPGTSPATEPATATVPVTPPATQPATESSILIGKLFCQSIDESGTAANPCVGRVEAAEGTYVNFIVRPAGTNDDHHFRVLIRSYNGMTIGVLRITGVPLGTYEVCEDVPDGYTGFPAPMDDSQQAVGSCLRITVGADEVTATFVNVPITAPPTSEASPVVVPTEVQPLPSEIATVEVPETHLASPTSVPFATPAAVTLPATGAGSSGSGNGPMWWLAMSAIGLIGLAALTAKRRDRR